MSARNYQRADGQWARAKGFDTFAPFGPTLAVGLDPGALAVECRVNGETRQRGHTSDLLFSPAFLVHFISRIMTLEPGDVIATGTPAGVASYILTVYGADRLGIVAEITGALAALGGNITDLTTRLSGALYLLSAEVDLPGELDSDEVLDQLDQAAAELGVDVSLRPTEADVL